VLTRYLAQAYSAGQSLRIGMTHSQQVSSRCTSVAPTRKDYELRGVSRDTWLAGALPRPYTWGNVVRKTAGLNENYREHQLS